MANWSESQFIKWVKGKIDSEANVLGHYEDAVATKIGNEFLVVNVDGWVESTDRPRELKLDACAYRAVANAVSDVLVKGARPDGMVVSASLPKSYTNELEEIIDGIVAASHDFKVPYLGGDLNAASDLVLDVTVWGRTNKLVTRSGAQVGDNVYWLGPALGKTSAALGVLTKDWVGSRKQSLAIYGSPQLFPAFLHIEATSAIDSSDGVAKSLYSLVMASGIGIQLDATIVIDDWVKTIALTNEIKVSELIFYGGEELGIVFTIPPEKQVPEECVRLGKVIEGDKVWLGDEVMENRGWEHFA